VATRQQQEAEVEVEIDPDMDPATSEVTRPSDLGFPSAQPPEIEVEPVRDPVAPTGYYAPGTLVEIRMAETIEEFTYGNPHRHWPLEAGRRYRVPVEIANYLYHLGKLSIRQ